MRPQRDDDDQQRNDSRAARPASLSRRELLGAAGAVAAAPLAHAPARGPLD